MKQRTIIVTARKVEAAIRIKETGNIEVAQKSVFFGRPITDSEWNDAKYLAKLSDEQLQCFLEGKRRWRYRLTLKIIWEGKRR